jgi:CRISPR-associated protein Csb2
MIYEAKSKRKPDRQVAVGQIFVQPPKPRFRQVAYDSPPARLLFDLVGERAPWRLDRIVELTVCVRDAAAQKLKDKLPDAADMIHNAIVGRRDANQADKAARVRITPLPSIGHQHADQAIRRILVEIPPNCPLRVDDLEWTFAGLPICVVDDGEIICELVLAAERGMLAHYAINGEEAGRLWRTVTPVALPQRAARRRINPMHRNPGAKDGAERAAEEAGAAIAVTDALRHAGVSGHPLDVRVQREPFEAKGERAEAFAAGPRFAKERLWHVEIEFRETVSGPLVIGDGRYLGLGLMRPVRGAWRDMAVFRLPLDAHVALTDRRDLLHAVRRALMALARDDKGNIPPLFSGHEADGAPASSGRHQHVFLACADLDRDAVIPQVIVAAPWACDRPVRPNSRERAEFDRVVGSLEAVRAGRLSVIPLRIAPAHHRLIGPALIWESHTGYCPTRHAGRGKEVTAALLHDVIAECDRRGLPRPEAELLEMTTGPRNGGISARLRLRFAVSVVGPILLGRDSHQGGGLFLACD